MLSQHTKDLTCALVRERINTIHKLFFLSVMRTDEKQNQ